MVIGLVLNPFSDVSVEMEGVTTLVDAMKFAALTTDELMVVVLSEGTVKGAVVISEFVVSVFVTIELVLIVFVEIAFVVVLIAFSWPVYVLIAFSWPVYVFRELSVDTLKYCPIRLFKYVSP